MNNNGEYVVYCNGI